MFHFKMFVIILCIKIKVSLYDYIHLMFFKEILSSLSCLVFRFAPVMCLLYVSPSSRVFLKTVRL